MRVFLDTNVLVSAFTTRGICADILTVILAEHELLIGESILKELPRVLRVKMRMAPQIIEEAVIFLRQEGAVVTAESIPELPVIRDPDDRQIIAEALAGVRTWLFPAIVTCSTLLKNCQSKSCRPEGSGRSFTDQDRDPSNGLAFSSWSK